MVDSKRKGSYFGIFAEINQFLDTMFPYLSKELVLDRSPPSTKTQEFMRICLKYHPVDIGDDKQGNIHQDDIDIQTLISNQGDGAGAAAVFTDLDTLQKVIEELIQADLDLSINISGLLEEVHACSRKAGIERYSVEHSLGFWDARDRLPEREVLEFNTMCGHGMVSLNPIRKLIQYVKLRHLSPKEAATIMAKCCECGVFNPVRAETLLEKIRKGDRETG